MPGLDNELAVTHPREHDFGEVELKAVGGLSQRARQLRLTGPLLRIARRLQRRRVDGDAGVAPHIRDV